MKPLLILSVLLLAQSALADSFTIIRDNREYLCTATTPTDPNGALDCAAKAYAGPFSKDEAERICQGSRSVAPADCALKLYAGPFNKEQAIQLCVHAKSTGPADCATKVYAGPFSQEEALELCSGDTSAATADCALKAYAGPYSKAEAIRLCKAEPQLLMRSLHLMQHSVEIQKKVKELKRNYPELSR